MFYFRRNQSYSSPLREEFLLLPYPHRKPLRQLCLLTVEASKRALSIGLGGLNCATVLTYINTLLFKSVEEEEHNDKYDFLEDEQTPVSSSQSEG